MANEESAQELLRGFAAQFPQNSGMSLLLSSFLEYANRKYADAVLGAGEAQILAPIILPAKPPPLASQVAELNAFVKDRVQEVSNLWRSYCNHLAAASKFDTMKADPAFSDHTKPLPTLTPKFICIEPPKFTVSDNLPADARTGEDAAAATAARAYAKTLIEQLALSKTNSAKELKTLIDGHRTSFDSDLEKMFSENVPTTEKVRLIESANLDYSTAVDAAKAKFEIAATDRVRVQEKNKTKHAAAKLAALQKKDGKTLGAAVDAKIAVFGQQLKEKNHHLVVPVLDTACEPHLMENAEMQSRTGAKGSGNGKGASTDLQAGAAKTKQGAARKGASKKKKGKKKAAAAAAAKAAAKAAAPTKSPLSKKRQQQQQRKQQQQQQPKKAPGGSSRSAAKGGGAGRKRKQPDA
jgi:hypothetical protein